MLRRTKLKPFNPERGPRYLKRKTKLQANPAAVRAWQRRSARNDDPIPEAVKAEVLARAHNCCERCGKPATARTPLEFHHILKRRHVATHEADKLAALCRACHAWTEDAPEAARAEGFSVRGNWLPLKKGQRNA